MVTDESFRNLFYECAAHRRQSPSDISGIRSGQLSVLLQLAVLAAGIFSLSLLIGRQPVNAADVEDPALSILARRCLNCHNAIDRKGGLSLQTKEELAQSGFLDESSPAESELLKAVIVEHGETAARMPKGGPSLSGSDVATLRRWLENGAEWPDGITLQEPVVDSFDWWSFRPLVEPEIPRIDGIAASVPSGWDQNPIDAFVLDALRERQLTPSPAADRRTLIRRLSFDLRGLPPSPGEVTEFLEDQSADSYERLVDRMLESPQYGERWARHWLDVVKYADTCGYDKDKLRPAAWPYRDYVIRAFNQDKPYTRFVQEQLAGDVLFPGTPDGIVALGFIAAGPWDFIGHVEVPESKIDGRVARNLDRDDMVSSALNTFCSVTIQCARCHNHKFDPFTQQQYYGLQAVFAAVDRAERPWNSDAETEQQRRMLTSGIEECRRELDRIDAAVRESGGNELVLAEKRISELRPRTVPTVSRAEFGYHSQIATSAETSKWVEINLGRSVDAAEIVLNPCYDDFNGIGAGFGFPVRFQVEAASGNDGSEYRTVADYSAADVSGPGLQALRIPRSSLSAAGLSSLQRVRITATRLALRQNDYILALAELQVLDGSGNNVAVGAAVHATDSIEAAPRWAAANLTDGIYPKVADAAAVEQLQAAERERAAILSRVETSAVVQQRNELKQKLANLEETLGRLSAPQMVYAAATHFQPQANFKPTQGVPRAVHVLHRGNETQPMEAAVPGTIPLSQEDHWQFSLKDPNNEGERRAALANWVTQKDHPLTWRSIVNRVWQYHFGRPLADSPNDFGRMGALPSHPELLDWLAVDFRDQGQSFRRLHRMIVTSAAWRQSSAIRGDHAEIDSDNQFLWRMNRRRLEAEEIRDAVLSVSGRLNSQMGGPGFYLFDLEKTDHSPHYEYHTFDLNDVRSHRRSIYRFIVRSQPDPFLTTLDCADSSQSTPRRTETQTSLQALSLLNNRFHLTMAQHFAARLKDEGHPTGSGIRGQISHAVELALGRPASGDELADMEGYVNRYGMDNLCRLLFNMSEFVFVD